MKKKLLLTIMIFFIGICGVRAENNCATKGDGIPICSYEENNRTVRIFACPLKDGKANFMVSNTFSRIISGYKTTRTRFNSDNVPKEGIIHLESDNSFSSGYSIKDLYISRPAYDRLLLAAKNYPKDGSNSKYCPEKVYTSKDGKGMALARSMDSINVVQKKYDKSIKINYSLAKSALSNLPEQKIDDYQNQNKDLKIDLKKEEKVELRTTKVDCDTLLGSATASDSPEPAYYLTLAFNFLKYLAILVLIVFTIIDFVKAVTASDDDAIKKSSEKFVKRLILAIAIFVLPTLIVLLLRWGGLITDPRICGIG